MAEEIVGSVDMDTGNDEIMLAATNHDIEALTALFKTHGANFKDPDTGFSPLHAAIAACEPDDDVPVNGEGDALHGQALSEDSALATIKLLLENGAIWNELDHNDETPGCLALRLGLKSVYSAIVDAGVRAELLFGRLDKFQLLADDESDDDDIVGFEPAPASMATVRPPGASNGPKPVLSNPNVNNEDYLKSELTYSGDRLLDSDKNAVMMDWETEIMKTSADQLCPKPGLRTMNVGHGMGIVDSMFLENKPEMHHIIEAHPAVIKRLKDTGWYDKPNVTIHEGRWQDVLPKLIKQGVVLDGIYYDTYAEDYKDLKEFFQEYVITLLDQKGRFGFYNGLGADRQVCYDVYTKVVEIDLYDAGLDVEWTDIKVPDLKGRDEWNGVRYPYWGTIDTYRLPTCKFVGG
ncbi:arginine N-methyltransferase 2 [Piedraia hortae CBS 480.64]|uniref:Arginine N-methyltransferase 2 n=1 Tax=Piedraia hortae CBS 480.64 TaxID=1314780 RepID=A0A6A7BWW6_9PEZI|nr:arginine N-methyltransferase 2 [Piedraia hortae CBS 480.64]